jgi:hypothetical protein
MGVDDARHAALKGIAVRPGAVGVLDTGGASPFVDAAASARALGVGHTLHTRALRVAVAAGGTITVGRALHAGLTAASTAIATIGVHGAADTTACRRVAP